MDARVLERRVDLSARLIENRWSGSSLGDGWTLEMSVPLSDEEGDRLLGSLGPGSPLSPLWECGDDEAPEFA